MTNWREWCFDLNINLILDEEYQRLDALRKSLGDSAEIFSDLSLGGEPGCYTFVVLQRRAAHAMEPWPTKILRRGAIYVVPADAPCDNDGNPYVEFAVPLAHSEAFELVEAVTIYTHGINGDISGIGYKCEYVTPSEVRFEPA